MSGMVSKKAPLLIAANPDILKVVECYNFNIAIVVTTRYHIPRSWLQESDNLLVIFEETGGNPFNISINPHSTRTICAEVSESHYPPLHIWSHPDIVQGKISISDIPPEMHLQCDDGQTITSISFASYGTPRGGCQKLSRGNCHASSSLSVVTKACQGRNRCSIDVSNAVFGADPCRGTIKTLAVEATCILSSYIGATAQ
ncbi:hypothetical protein HHK36_013073 [Tetracentron sinense]|uniref:beta-galactosidase n=1 Tax=Tetracentron sinense TaxID=13715 RepID=A0A835DG94_TETSI|nr:hypothetical protein HHK36_013073 [Tetracentron sinense]